MFFGPLVPAIFKSRPNRFLAIVEIEGMKVDCFVPNPGRLRELLQPDVRVYIKRAEGGIRRTAFDLALVEHKNNLVSVDSRVPNKVVEEAIKAFKIPEFQGYRVERREPIFGDSRFDLQLMYGAKVVLLEVKSCTLVVGGVAFFPDAPTERGSRHLHTLTRALREGRSAFMFLIQRSDADVLCPNRETDPGFSDALEEAQLKGVEVFAYDSKVTLEGITINKRVPVKI